MNAKVSFGSSTTFKLAQAILIYDAGNGSASATVHPVQGDDASPRLGPGTPATREAVTALAHQLGQQITTCLLPERVLAVSHRLLVWWTPARKARIWFKPALPEDRQAEAAALRELNGCFVQHPPLLFALQPGALTVRALGRNVRPKATQPLYVAPYFNLARDGNMCIGSAALPHTINPEHLARYEAAFYQSAFSHSNWGHSLTRHPGGHTGYWQSARTTAPTTQLLCPAKQTVAQFITKHSK